jgi:hypothetical protein
MANRKSLKELEQKLIYILRYVVAVDQVDAEVNETAINEFKDSVSEAFDKFESEFVDEQCKEHEAQIMSLAN